MSQCISHKTNDMNINLFVYVFQACFVKKFAYNKYCIVAPTKNEAKFNHTRHKNKHKKFKT